MAMSADRQRVSCDRCGGEESAVFPGPSAYYPPGWIIAAVIGPRARDDNRQSPAFCSWDCLRWFAAKQHELGPGWDEDFDHLWLGADRSYPGGG